MLDLGFSETKFLSSLNISMCQNQIKKEDIRLKFEVIYHSDVHYHNQSTMFGSSINPFLGNTYHNNFVA